MERSAKLLKDLLRFLIPYPVRRYRWRVISIKYQNLAQRLHLVTSGVVISGPFQGLRYIGSSTGSMLGPKLLGTYEVEIAPLICTIISSDYDNVVDIGAAEGYYAIGLLSRNSQFHMMAYEASDIGQDMLMEMAKLNGVEDRISIRGLCTCDELASVIDVNRKTLIMCDAEGAEAELLDPERVSQLDRCDILVEVHDFIMADISGILLRRFEKTHEITRVKSQRRLSDNLPNLSNFTTHELLMLSSEFRPSRMEWLWMRAVK